jgi:hypothetical protein
MNLSFEHPDSRKPLLAIPLNGLDLGSCELKIDRSLKGQIPRKPVLLTLCRIKADIHSSSLSTLS